MLAGHVHSHELRSTGCAGLSLMGLESYPWASPSCRTCESKYPSEMVLDSAQTPSETSGVGPSGFMAFSGITYAAGSIPGARRFVLR